MGKGVWGIDISKYSIKAVRMEKSADGLTLTQAAVEPFDAEDLADPGALEEQIRFTLEDLKNRLRIGGERVVLSMPGHSTFNRLIKLPPVADEKIPEVVRYEAQSQIPFNIDEVIWDYQLVDRQYGPGEEKEVILFAIKRDIVEQFLKNIEPLRLNIEAIQFAPVALYNFITHDQDLGASAVVLDMGGDNTDLVIVDGAKFWIRNLPITGNDITKAIQKAFNIPFAEAEKLKVKAGQSQQAQKIFNTVQPVLRDLVGEIHRSIGYYKSISKSIKFDKIVLFGNSTKTLNFQKFLSQSLQMPAVRVQALKHIGMGKSLNPAEFNDNFGTLGTAIGLALQGYGEGNNKVNLLPQSFIKKKELRKKQPFIAGIAVMLYALVFIMWLTERGELQALEEVVRQAKSASNTYREQTELFQKASDYKGNLDQLRHMASISHERDLIIKVMNQILPNVPHNGNRQLEMRKKLWILEWQFKEELPPGEGGGGGPKPYPRTRKLTITIEGAIAKRSFGEIPNFVQETLLNVDSRGKKVDPNKPCVVETFRLIKDDIRMGYSIVPSQDETFFLIPKRDETQAKAAEMDGQPEFQRFTLTLWIPMGEEQRNEVHAIQTGGRK